MKALERLFLCSSISVGIALATAAFAGSVPSTRYDYDNNGNLHSATMAPYDGACDAFVSTTEMCGSCTNKCAIPANGTATCAWNCGETSCSGTCGILCNSPFRACSGACVDLTGLNNCGGCGQVCATNHFSPSCEPSYCWYDETRIPQSECSFLPRYCAGACEAGWGDCDGNRNQFGSNGCETSLATVSACGACGAACSTNHIDALCSGTPVACNGPCVFPWADCNADKRSDGCETNLAGDINNCGGCGVACSTNHITPACAGWSCSSGVCAAGYSDCNGDKQSDGCEANLLTDKNHCGSCTNVCPTGASWVCSTGQCVCQARTCSSAGYECGTLYDGCGAYFNCGTCSSGLACSGGQCIVNQPDPDDPDPPCSGRLCF